MEIKLTEDVKKRMELESKLEEIFDKMTIEICETSLEGDVVSLGSGWKMENEGRSGIVLKNHDIEVELGALGRLYGNYSMITEQLLEHKDNIIERFKKLQVKRAEEANKLLKIGE